MDSDTLGALGPGDIAAVILYFVVILGVGLYVSFNLIFYLLLVKFLFIND